MLLTRDCLVPGRDVLVDVPCWLQGTGYAGQVRSNGYKKSPA